MELLWIVTGITNDITLPRVWLDFVKKMILLTVFADFSVFINFFLTIHGYFSTTTDDLLNEHENFVACEIHSKNLCCLANAHPLDLGLIVSRFVTIVCTLTV